MARSDMEALENILTFAYTKEEAAAAIGRIAGNPNIKAEDIQFFVKSVDSAINAAGSEHHANDIVKAHVQGALTFGQSNGLNLLGADITPTSELAVAEESAYIDSEGKNPIAGKTISQDELDLEARNIGVALASEDLSPQERNAMEAGAKALPKADIDKNGQVTEMELTRAQQNEGIMPRDITPDADGSIVSR